MGASCKGSTRRSFLKGAFAAAGVGAFGRMDWLAARAAGLAQGEVKLRFGVLSDVHIKTSAEVPVFKRALEYFRSQAVDAVMICGDIADGGKIAELQLAADAWYEVFPGNKLPGGATVEKLIVSGNHDWGVGQTSSTALLRTDFAKNWKDIWQEDSYSKVWQKTVKGYTFIGNNWDCTSMAESPTSHVVTAYDDLPDYLTEHASELTGTKPFFYVQHVHEKGTCFGKRAWGEDTGQTTTALSNFPNAVAISGHSHLSLTDERTLWHGAFTAVNAGSLAYTGLDDAELAADSGAFEYENGYSGDSKTMAQYARQDGKQGMLVTVYDDAIVYHRREFAGAESRVLGEDWVQALPAADHATDYDYATRAAAFAAPEFPAGARVTGVGCAATTRKGLSASAMRYEFPAANAGGGYRPHSYEIKFIGEDATRPVVRYVLAQGFNMPLSDALASGRSTVTLATSLVPAGATVRIEVTPLSAYETRGTPIAVTVDGDALRSGRGVVGGLSVVGF